MEPKVEKNVTLDVRPSLVGDCVYLAKHLREADKNEVQAVLGKCDLEALVLSWSHTKDPYTIFKGETPAGVFGVAPVWPGIGCVWLVGTEDLVRNRWSFLRQSKGWLDRISSGYGLLYNYVDERNTAHIRWIEWLGFTFIARHENHGYEQRPFLEFVRIV